MPFAATTFAFFGLISNTKAAPRTGPGWESQNEQRVAATPAARETVKLSSSIWKRVIAPLETVRMSAKADSKIFPVALILVLS